MKNVRRGAIYVFMLFLFFSFAKNIIDYRRSVNFFNGYKSDYEKEKKNNIGLKTQILKSSDSYEIEKSIRNKLNLSKPDEVSIILANPTPTPTVITPTPAPIYRQWWNSFF